MTLPLKTRVLEYAIVENRPFTADELTEVLKKEYPGERFVNVKHIDDTINSYVGVGCMKPEVVEFDKNGDLYVEYMVTETGKKYLKRIPGHFAK